MRDFRPQVESTVIDHSVIAITDGFAKNRASCQCWRSSIARDAPDPEGKIMKTSVAAVVLGIIMTMALAAAAASVPAKSHPSLIHVSLLGGHHGLVPVW